MNNEIRENAEDLFAEATKAVDLLYSIRDTYFPANPDDKTSKLLTESNLALQLLDRIPQEKRKMPGQRATYEYLRGKVLDVFPEYKKEAEDHLSKAVKLNPSLADAWLSLGNCIWKKGDLVSAKNCFTLGLSKGPHKGLLCQLSMLERKMAQGSEDQVKIVDDSIKHAKEAISLDVKDGNSWYNLGNACLTSFFVTGSWDHGKLLQSLKSYQHAEKDERMKSNPDLYFNCAIVNKYLENYERALSGFEAAALRDPGLNAMEEVQKIIRLLDKIDSSLRGQTKVKRLASLASSLASVNLNPSYRKETIDCLSDGLNKAVGIVGKVIFFIKHENVAPFYYLLCDPSQICYVLSVYGVHNEAGRFSEAKVDSFNIPNYLPTLEQLKAILQRTENFSVEKMKIIENNGKYTFSNISSRVAFSRAVYESTVAHHFGGEIIDELCDHLEKKLTASPVFNNVNNDKTNIILAVLKKKNGD